MNRRKQFVVRIMFPGLCEEAEKDTDVEMMSRCALSRRFG
jgi:hypothetical protein